MGGGVLGLFLYIPDTSRPPGTWSASLLMPQAWFPVPSSSFLLAWPLWAVMCQVGRRKDLALQSGEEALLMDGEQAALQTDTRPRPRLRVLAITCR